MNLNMRKLFLTFTLSICACIFAFAQRAELSLDGVWKIAEGKFSKIPEEFNSEIQVPGLVDMARPAFKDVGAKTLKERGLKPHYPVDSLREAFWYRRDFDFNLDLPQVAYIKLNKAAFSAKVYINGHFAGEHKPSYTAGYFDVKPFLKKGKNEILIAIGASPAAMGGGTA